MWRVGWLGSWRVCVVICRAKRTELRDVVFALNVCGEFCVIGRVFHVAQSKHFIRVRRISIKLKLAHIHIYRYIVHVLHTNFELCIVYGGCCWVAVPFFYYTRYICVFVYISKEESWQNKGGFVWTSLRVCGRSVCVCVCVWADPVNPKTYHTQRVCLSRLGCYMFSMPYIVMATPTSSPAQGVRIRTDKFSGPPQSALADGTTNSTLPLSRLYQQRQRSTAKHKYGTFF